ncbi:hypothetical protein OP10G_1564 [Fimbriimonas ginsengisoli Gsoil 348]|uniref:Copper amine oxidase-like N-terminal domain-containing protein n=1 Tax=Fimbriimonas ginsengisoli Gsoil 348 TaxID=661478 RepID=A0A068NNE5_FIMGI|nr:hypothetical protein OP10G_1564 [Fimbriimonas ginsengisoli Gsoil 348]
MAFSGGQAGTQQLIGKAGQTGASVNGASANYSTPPVQIQGRTMVPLRETLTMLGMSLGNSGGFQTVGSLQFSGTFNQILLGGSSIPLDGNLVQRGDTMFISAKLLADGIGAKLRAGEGGEFYITLIRESGGDPALPQPRFTTDKDSYGIGEPVKVEEFSFHPLGEPFGLRWSNLKPAYYKPGPVTIALDAVNGSGRGNRLTRTITITDRVVNSPLSFAVKYGEVGDTLDDNTLARPTLPRQDVAFAGPKFLFSDSPESPERVGLLYKDTFDGEARLLAYHMNNASVVARLYVVARNVSDAPATVRTARIGDTAPARVEGVLGQVTLLSFLTGRQDSRIQLGAGESALIYVSPLLAPRTGASLMADLSSDRKIELTVAMGIGEDALSTDSLLALAPLPADTNHVRGTFPSAARRFTLDLATTLPAKAIIGDPGDDPAEEGQDVLSGAKVSLSGNYGVTYEVTLKNAEGVVGAIAPRGGLYKGVVTVEEVETGRKEIVRLPRSGVLSTPNQPMIFLRSGAKTVKLGFIPASGSHLPVHLAFYRP